MDQHDISNSFTTALNAVSDLILAIPDEERSQPSPLCLQLSHVLDQLANVAPRQVQRGLGIPLSILRSIHRSLPEVPICSQDNEDAVGTSTDMDGGMTAEAAGGTSTVALEQVSIATQTTNGNVNRTIALVPVPDFTPLVGCFIDHLEDLEQHRAIACPEFMVTMSSLERSQVIIQERLCRTCWRLNTKDHPKPCPHPAYCAKCKTNGHHEVLCTKYFLTQPKVQNPRRPF